MLGNSQLDSVQVVSRDSLMSRYSESDGGANPVVGLAIASWAQKFKLCPDSMVEFEDE